MCVGNYVRRMQRTNTPTILLKLDIKKAFDSVRWEFLLDLMQRRGFPAKFLNMVAAFFLLSTSSRVILNESLGIQFSMEGVLGKAILYLRFFLILP